MLPLNTDSLMDPINANSIKTRAINLRASDGLVTKIEVLITPDAEINGILDNPMLSHI